AMVFSGASCEAPRCATIIGSAARVKEATELATTASTSKIENRMKEVLEEACINGSSKRVGCQLVVAGKFPRQSLGGPIKRLGHPARDRFGKITMIPMIISQARPPNHHVVQVAGPFLVAVVIDQLGRGSRGEEPARLQY